MHTSYKQFYCAYAVCLLTSNNVYIKHTPKGIILKLLSGSFSLVLLGLLPCFASVKLVESLCLGSSVSPYLINC